MLKEYSLKLNKNNNGEKRSYDNNLLGPNLYAALLTIIIRVLIKFFLL